MLVICLLAASFTGCLGSDDIVDEVPVEEETIEPVGTGDNGGNETNNYYYNNDTYYVNGTDYLELISQVENLTVEVEELTIEVEELTDEIKDLTSEIDKLSLTIGDMIYNPEENSTVSMFMGNKEYNNFTKIGNTIHVTTTHNTQGYVWFEDNNGIVIKMGALAHISDRCNLNGTWYPITNETACSGNTEEISYEINLPREPVSVHVGYQYSYQRVESFP